MQVTTTAYDIRFELRYYPQTEVAEYYLLAVPQELAVKVSKYLSAHGCKFTGKWQRQFNNRQVFYIEKVGNPGIIQALAERTKANHGRVDLTQLTVNPIAQYWAALNDGKVETLEKLWADIEWCPDEMEDAYDCTYESALNMTAMYLNDIKYPLGILIASLV